MIGAALRRRLNDGERMLMVNPHHVSSGFAARLCELGADAVFLDREHGPAGDEDIRAMAAAARGASGGAIVRPASRDRSTMTRCLNRGADGPMVQAARETARGRPRDRPSPIPPCGTDRCTMVIKRYHPPEPPMARALAHAAVSEADKARLRAMLAGADPVSLSAGDGVADVLWRQLRERLLPPPP